MNLFSVWVICFIRVLWSFSQVVGFFFFFFCLFLAVSLKFELSLVKFLVCDNLLFISSDCILSTFGHPWYFWLHFGPLSKSRKEDKNNLKVTVFGLLRFVVCQVLKLAITPILRLLQYHTAVNLSYLRLILVPAFNFLIAVSSSLRLVHMFAVRS